MMPNTFQRRSVAVAVRYVHTVGWLLLMALVMVSTLLVKAMF